MVSGEEYLISDEALREAVFGALKQDERTARLDVRVGVLNAVVHLGGAAATEDEWFVIEQIVSAIPGVRGVVNRITAPGAPSPARTVNINLTGDPQSGDLEEER